MGLANIESALEVWTARKNAMQLRQIMLTQEKSLKCSHACGEITALNDKMTQETDAVRNALPEDASSDDLQEMRDGVESIENQYEIAIQNVQDQMSQVETRMDTDIEQLKTQIQVADGNIKSLEEGRDKVVDRVSTYFQN